MAKYLMAFYPVVRMKEDCHGKIDAKNGASHAVWMEIVSFLLQLAI